MSMKGSLIVCILLYFSYMHLLLSSLIQPNCAIDNAGECVEGCLEVCTIQFIKYITPILCHCCVQANTPG